MHTSIKKFTTITTAFALACGATLTLSGCFGNPLEGLAQGGVNNIIKEATGADVDLGGKSIPQGFPNQVPVAEGEIEYGGSITSDGETIWTLRIKTNDPDAFTKVQSQLLSSGFEEGFVTDGESKMGSYEGHGYGLILNMDAIDGSYNLTYLVSTSDEE